MCTIRGLYIPVYLHMIVNESYTITDVSHDVPYVIDIDPHRQRILEPQISV
jgi:hypothetical protein